MTDHQQLISQAYRAFNDKDLDTVLALLHPDVCWPRAWEGGYVNGREEVRQYWLRQGQELNSTVTPVSFNQKPDGQIEVTVHQRVTDQQGQVLVDGLVLHTYTIAEGQLKRMDIGKHDSA